MNTKSIVVFSGYNNRALIAFFRTLASLDVPFHIVASDSKDPVFKTTYKKHVIATRKSKLLDKDEIIKILKHFRADSRSELLVAPSTESLNRFFLENRDFFEKNGVFVPLVEKSLYEKISDKKPFSELCKSFGIPIPAEYADLKSAPVPFVAKPKTYADAGGNHLSPILVHSEKQKKNFMENEDSNSYYYQEFVSGGSYYLLFYITKNRKVHKFSQENLIQQPGGKSIVAAVGCNLHHSKAAAKFQEMLTGLGFHGFIMIEVRGSIDELRMIEANPRFWGPSQFFVDSSTNLFLPFLKEYGIISDLEMNGRSNVSEFNRYFWEGGIYDRESMDFHNYSRVEFDLELDAWKSCDIYRRNDILES
ncbi:MAG: hypothetical protein HWE12_04905 [Oceanospirillaceae bacterium]|nr:hypothetical protein [Oceanospirillaceae bacterium]